MSGYSFSDFLTRFGGSKPPLPYFQGQQFVVQAHNTPPRNERWPSYNPNSLHERNNFHPLDRCLLHPPSPGSDGSQTVRLEITKAIRFGDNKTSQIGLVKVLEVSSPTSHGPPTDTTLVAKFYDTLYFDHAQDDCNPVFYTDYEYASEVAAYRAMSKFQGTIMPTFYGSFTLELPAKESEKRLVRLILMELMPGTPMDKLDPATFPQNERQNIMKSIVDMESTLHGHGISHGDVYPRNVLVDTKEDSSRNLYLIDFGHAMTSTSHFSDGSEENKRYPIGTRISPILRWNADRSNDIDCFKAWIDWDWQPWLEETYKDTKESVHNRRDEEILGTASSNASRLFLGKF